MFLKPSLLAKSAGCCLSLVCAGLLLRTSFAEEKASATENSKIVIGPDYTTDPDLTDKGNPKGKSFSFTMPLSDSKIFRGDDATLSVKRRVCGVLTRWVLPRADRSPRSLPLRPQTR